MTCSRCHRTFDAQPEHWVCPWCGWDDMLGRESQMHANRPTRIPMGFDAVTCTVTDG